MKKFLIAAVALSTLVGAAGAASAQPYYGPGYGYDRDGRGGYDRDGDYGRRGDSRDLNRRQHELRVAVDRAAQYGRLSRREAETLRYEIRQINAMERSFRYSGGLSPQEFRILDQRLDRLERRLHREMADRDGRAGRGGYGSGYDGRRY